MPVDEDITTVRITRATRELFKQVALSGEAFWETADRVVKEYIVSRLKKE
jgi:hypothetical protein